ncbi:ependymin [Engraulis encrasicolus]|uniref:ependymin n=1 Tax=Engraulis encrasicolus TaxID=184585 RepID=UPI002FD6B406
MRLTGFLCLALCSVGVAVLADHHQPCRGPDQMHGTLFVTASKGAPTSVGEFHYDAKAKKLHFKDDEKHVNKTDHLEFLILFDEGIFYDFDSHNLSCHKRTLGNNYHILEIPANSTHVTEGYLGHEFVGDQGVRMRKWRKRIPELNGVLTVATTSCGCLTLTGSLFTEADDVLLFTFLDVETELRNPQVFVPPTYCERAALEDETDTFFGLFH